MNVDMQDVRRVVANMGFSTLHNYIIPGLQSTLLKAPDERGCIRLFEATAEQHNGITPHSHRYNFTCIVLKGRVLHTVWVKRPLLNKCDIFQQSTLTYEGAPGNYCVKPGEQCAWETHSKQYDEGENYSLEFDEVHSIRFARGTQVLFFEGPLITNETTILEPVVHGEVVPTFRVEPWMFKKV